MNSTSNTNSPKPRAKPKAKTRVPVRGAPEAARKRSRGGQQESAPTPLAEAVLAPEPKLRKDMSQDEIDKVTEWFAEAIRDCTDNMLRLKQRIDMTVDEDESNTLDGQRLDLQRKKGMLEKREEAFEADGSNQMMAPPSKADIAETRRLADALGQAIRDQATAEGIAKFVGDLAEFVSKVSKPA